MIKKSILAVIFAQTFFVGAVQAAQTVSVPFLKANVSSEKFDAMATDIEAIYAEYGNNVKASNGSIAAGKPLNIEFVSSYNDKNEGNKYSTIVVFSNKVVQVEGTPAEIGKKLFDEVNKRN